MERIALRPWDRGWAAPKTFKLPVLGALKFGAPWMFRSRSSARPACACQSMKVHEVFLTHLKGKNLFSR